MSPLCHAFSLSTCILLNDGPACYIQSLHGGTKEDSARHVCSKLCVFVHARVARACARVIVECVCI